MFVVCGVSIVPLSIPFPPSPSSSPFGLPLPFETYLSKLQSIPSRYLSTDTGPAVKHLSLDLYNYHNHTHTHNITGTSSISFLDNKTPFDTDTILPRLAEDAFHLLPDQLSTRPNRPFLCSCLQHNNHTDAIHILQIKVEWVKERQET